MTAPARPLRMDADEFIAWAMEQPRGRYELVEGEVVAMAPERADHAEAKLAAATALRQGIGERGLPCQAFVDGLGVRIDRSTIYEPDALVRCGPKPLGSTVEIDDPVIVVEVVSPSSRATDSGTKLAGYFRLPTLAHYLIVDTEARVVIHHARREGERIETAILRDGPLRLDPPGLAVEVEAMLPAAEG